jgi:hypothetical protein
MENKDIKNESEVPSESMLNLTLNFKLKTSGTMSVKNPETDKK